MLKDPDYLAELGEFATLKNAIACSFHQDALAIHGDMDSIVRDFWDGHGADSAMLLIIQLQTILQRDSETIQALWDQYSDWMITSPEDTRTLFKILLAAGPSAA